MLEPQTQRANTFSDQMNRFGTEDRQLGNQVRQDVYNKYNDLYSGLGQDGGSGGGGGPAYSALNWKDARMNEAMPGYRDFANTGGFDTGQMQDYRSRATSTLPAIYEGLKGDLGRLNAASGGQNVGFNSQMAKLAREAGYGGQRVATDAEAGLQDMIRKNKMLGLEGVGKYDTEFMGNEQRVEGLRNQEIANANARAASNAANARAGSDADFRNKMAILGEMRGLRGESGSDLPYFDRDLAGQRQALGTIGARQNEGGFMDTLGKVANTGLGVAGAFMGPSGFGGKKKPNIVTSDI